MYENHFCFRATRTTRKGRQRARRQLALGPWMWPDATLHPSAHAYARRVAGVPTTLAAGEVALVTVREDHGALWSIRIEDEDHGEDAAFIDDAIEAWRDAATALPRSLPVVWDSISTLTRRLPRARRLIDPRHTRALDGRSLGLAFALAMASRHVLVPLPGDFVATAQLDEHGRLGTVDGLDAKIRVIGCCAPGVRRLIVAREQVEQARAIVARGRFPIEVLGFEHLGGVLDVLIEDLEKVWRQRGDSESSRIDHVRTLFRLAVGEGSSMIEWGPVARAATDALEQWRDQLDSRHVEMLRFAQAVANRHHDNRGELLMPRAAWMRELPRPLRVRVMAHVVQQAADTGTPDAAELFEQAPPYLEQDDLDMFAPQLELLGALGRLHYSARGDLERAIQYQLRAARAWLERWDHAAAAYPISYLYMLVGVAASEHASLTPEVNARAHDAQGLFEQAQLLEARMWRGGQRCRENAHVMLARARALVELGREDEALDVLEQLYERRRLDENIVGGAIRWMLRCARIRQDETRCAELAARLEDLGARHIAERSRALIELDDALRAQDDERARAAAELLRQQQPALVELLLRGVNVEISAAEAPAILARRYPY